LKICDFGLARGVEDEQFGELTEYVVTRWYRAPEIMLACHEYTKAIDIWSVGCILGELLGRQALLPGNDYIAQLRLICEKLGRPKEEQMDFITSDRAKRFISALPDTSPIAMNELFPNYKDDDTSSKIVTDLFQKMMTFHPAHRITIDEALKHPFMSSLHNPEDEPITNFTFQFPFENETLSKERVQELIWEEIHELHPDIPLSYPSGAISTQTTQPGGGGDDTTSVGREEEKENENKEGEGETEGDVGNQKKRMRADSGDKEERDGERNGNGDSNIEQRQVTEEEPVMIRQRTE
jgi:serine/threonine protein kinase